MAIYAAYKSICKTKVFSILIILQFSMSFFLGNLLFYNTNNMKMSNQKRFLTVSNKTKLQLSDNLVNLHVLYEDLHALNRVKEFYRTLVTMKEINYYETIVQPIQVGDFRGGEIFGRGYEYGASLEETNYFNQGTVFSSINGLMINKEVVDQFRLNVKEGNLFNEEDYTLKDDTIPAIMGHEYSQYYKSGDILKAKHLAKDFNLKIIGFFEQDTGITVQSHILYLDRYIVIPALNCPNDPVDEEEQKFQARLYMQKINGTVELQKNMSIVKFVSNFQELLQRYGMFDFSILRISNLEMQLLQLASQRSYDIVKFIFGGMIIFSAITLAIILLLKINVAYKDYGIHLISGGTLKDIQAQILVESICFLLISHMVSFTLTIICYRGEVNYSIDCLLFSIMIFVITMFVPMYYLRKQDINFFIRR